MKEGWTYKKLGEVFASINNGANIKQVKGAGGIPITRIETLSNDKFNRERMGYANIDDVSQYTSYVLNEGDILMSHINSMKFLGRAVAYKKKRNETIIHGMNLLRLVPTSEVLTPYMTYQFQTQFFRNQILQISHQSVNQASFNTTNLKELKVIIPPLSLQQRIVDRLDAAFAHIDELKANAEKQLSETRALIQKALTKAMEPKEGWEKKKLGELGELKNGMNFAHNEKGYNMFLLGVGDFGNRFSIDNVEQLSVISLNQKPSDEYMLKDGDIVFVRSNGNKQLVGRSVIVYPHKTPITFSGFCIRFRRNTSIINERFLVSFLKSEGTRKRLFGNGANISNLNQGMLQELIIPIPPLSEQQRIVSRLDSLSAHVRELEDVLQKTIAECDALKQALLRKVFE